MVSALGLTPYLSAGAYTELLALFAALALGSVVILDHAIPRDALAPARRATFDGYDDALIPRDTLAQLTIAVRD